MPAVAQAETGIGAVAIGLGVECARLPSCSVMFTYQRAFPRPTITQELQHSGEMIAKSA